MSEEEPKSVEEKSLPNSSEDWRERAERNRQRALLLRKSKVVAHPYANG